MQEIRQHIAREASPAIARAYIARLKNVCEGLIIAPHRGEARQGLDDTFRTIGFDRRISIVFAVSDLDATVSIVHFNYAGRNWDKP